MLAHMIVAGTLALSSPSIIPATMTWRDVQIFPGYAPFENGVAVPEIGLPDMPDMPAMPDFGWIPGLSALQPYLPEWGRERAHHVLYCQLEAVEPGQSTGKRYRQRKQTYESAMTDAFLSVMRRPGGDVLEALRRQDFLIAVVDPYSKGAVATGERIKWYIADNAEQQICPASTVRQQIMLYEDPAMANSSPPPSERPKSGFQDIY